MSAEQSFLPTNVRYFVTTDVDPGAIARVLEHFAVRGITPNLLKVSQYKQTSLIRDNLSFDIHVSGLSDDIYEVILQKLTSQVGVQSVRKENFFEIVDRKSAS